MWWTVFSFLAKFRTLARKKNPGECNKGLLGNFFKKSPYLEKKKLKLATFRQCAPVGRQN
jgi:hypothetical protein